MPQPLNPPSEERSANTQLIAWFQRRTFLLLCIANTLVLIAANTQRTFDEWRATHWTFNYDHGFIKRGLIGEIYQQFQLPLTLKHISITGWLISVVTAVTISALIYRTIARESSHPREPGIFMGSDSRLPVLTACIIATWLASGPGVIPQLFYDHGRFDAFAILLIAGSFLVTNGTPKYLALVLITALSGLSIVIHEAYFFWVPWITVGIWLARNKIERSDFVILFVFAATMAVFVLYVAGASYSDLLTFEQAILELSGTTNFDISEASLMVHYRELTDNLSYTVEHAWSPRRIISLLTAIGLLLPFIVVAFVFSRRAFETSRYSLLQSLVLVACVLAPVPLFVLGHDQGRWLSMLNINAMFVILIMVRQGYARSLYRTNWLPLFLGYAVFAQLSVGAFGIARALPRLPL